MSKRIKTIGAALIAIVAIALAISPVALAAPEFEGVQTEGPPTLVHTTLKGSASGSHEYSAGAGYGTVKCSTANTTGTSESGEATAIPAAPTYSGCTASSLTVHTRINGCTYRYHVSKELSADKFEGTADVVCAGGEEIEIETTKEGGGFKCLSTFGSQEGLAPVYFENQTSNPQDVLVEAKITNLKNKTSGGSPNCGIVNGEHTAGTYTGKTTLRGYAKSEAQVDVKLDGGAEPKLTGLETFEGPQNVHTILKGTQVASSNQLIPTKGFGSIKCPTASLSGTWATGKDTTLTATPSFAGCTLGELTTHVRTNGCDYKFVLGAQVTEDDFAASVNVSCPKTEEIEFEVTKSGGGLKCLVSIPTQEGAGTIYFENLTEKSPQHMELEWQLNNLKTRTAGGEANCGTPNGEHKDGAYTGETTVQGYNTAEAAIDVRVKGDPEPEFTALNTGKEAHESATIRAEQVEPHIFTVGPIGESLPISCKTAKAEGSLTEGTATQLTMTPEFKECSVEESWSVEIKMNGCDFLFHVSEAVGPEKSKGTLDIGCPGGKEIEMLVSFSSFKCTAKVATQTGLGPVFYEDVEEGGVRDVVATTEIENLHSVISGSPFFCGTTAIGTHTNGTYFGTSTLRAYNGGEAQIDFATLAK